jgi:uncharacterized phiE125 gp8 family phage protein
MSAILTTPPAAEPLSLSEAKAHLRITHNDDDTYISTLIISARRMLEARFGLALLAQSWSIFADSWPDDGMFRLPLHPILSINDLRVFGDDDVAATIDAAHYYLDSASRPARLSLRRGRIFPPPGRRVNGLEIRLQAGFAAVPQDIKQALLITIADWFGHRGDEQGFTLPSAAVELLQTYRPVRLT